MRPKRWFIAECEQFRIDWMKRSTNRLRREFGAASTVSCTVGKYSGKNHTNSREIRVLTEWIRSLIQVVKSAFFVRVVGINPGQRAKEYILCKETSWQTQNMLDELQIPSGLGTQQVRPGNSCHCDQERQEIYNVQQNCHPIDTYWELDWLPLQLIK